MPSGRRLAAGLLILAAASLAASALFGPALLGLIGNGAAALRFGLTLLPGREPLISRYSRFDGAGVPVPRYTRHLTEAWALLLGGFALAHAGLALTGHGTLVLALTEPPICFAFFLGEHALRNRRFPEHGPATPLRTLRAICLAHGVRRHAA